MMVAVCVMGAYTTHELHFCTSSWRKKEMITKSTGRQGLRERTQEALCTSLSRNRAARAQVYSHMAHTHTLKTDNNMAHHIAPLSLGLKERHATRLLRWVAWFIRSTSRTSLQLKKTAFLCTDLEVLKLAHATKGRSMHANCTGCWHSFDEGFERKKRKSLKTLSHRNAAATATAFSKFPGPALVSAGDSDFGHWVTSFRLQHVMRPLT